MKRHSHCRTHVTAKTLRPFLLPRCGVCRTCGSVGGSLGSDWSLLSPSRSHAHSMKSASLDLLRIASTCMIFENESICLVLPHRDAQGHSCNLYVHESYIWYTICPLFFSRFHVYMQVSLLLSWCPKTSAQFRWFRESEVIRCMISSSSWSIKWWGRRAGTNQHVHAALVSLFIYPSITSRNEWKIFLGPTQTFRCRTFLGQKYMQRHWGADGLSQKKLASSCIKPRASWAVHAAGHDEWNAFDAAFGGLVPLFQVSRFTQNWSQMGSWNTKLWYI